MRVVDNSNIDISGTITATNGRFLDISAALGDFALAEATELQILKPVGLGRPQFKFIQADTPSPGLFTSSIIQFNATTSGNLVADRSFDVSNNSLLATSSFTRVLNFTDANRATVAAMEYNSGTSRIQPNRSLDVSNNELLANNGIVRNLFLTDTARIPQATFTYNEGNTRVNMTRSLDLSNNNFFAIQANARSYFLTDPSRNQQAQFIFNTGNLRVNLDRTFDVSSNNIHGIQFIGREYYLTDQNRTLQARFIFNTGNFRVNLDRNLDVSNNSLFGTNIIAFNHQFTNAARVVQATQFYNSATDRIELGKSFDVSNNGLYGQDLYVSTIQSPTAISDSGIVDTALGITSAAFSGSLIGSNPLTFPYDVSRNTIYELTMNVRGHTDFGGHLGFQTVIGNNTTGADISGYFFQNGQECVSAPVTFDTKNAHSAIWLERFNLAGLVSRGQSISVEVIVKSNSGSGNFTAGNYSWTLTPVRQLPP
jgi:hypothetical protein